MFTSSVFARAVVPQPRPIVCIIWKCVYDHWDFFCRASPEDAEMRVHINSTLTGLDRSHYKVTQG
jgi:hypothetical protein